MRADRGVVWLEKDQAEAGGSNSGLGAALCAWLAQDGIDVKFDRVLADV